MYALNSHPTQQRTESVVHGVGRPRLNLGEIKSIGLPLPPISEQRVLSQEIERQFSVLNELETEVEAQMQRSEGLRQSILAQAFSGRLSGACIKSIEPEESWPRVAEPGAQYGSVTIRTTRN